MIKIYSAGSMVDAQMVCDALLDAGLDARVSGGYLTGAAGELPVDSLISVWLTEPLHESRARDVIQSIQGDSETPVSTMKCASCGEEVLSNFTHCWNCSVALT